MQASDSVVANVVSAVFRHDTALQLVEDTWTSDSLASPPENLRTWCPASGSEIATATWPAGSDSARGLAERVIDALVGAVMERAAVTGESAAVAVHEGGAVAARGVPNCLTVDGTPRSGIVASSGGTTAAGVIAGSTIVLAIYDQGPVSVDLGPLGSAPALGIR